MAKFKKRMEAIQLRRQGWSIRNIAKHLDVSKGSASLWCKEVELTDDQLEVLIKAGNRGRLMGAEFNRNKKRVAVADGKEYGRVIMKKITKRDLLVAGVALYWAEGSKKDNRVSFSNSDPVMIIFIYKWFKEIFKVKNEDFMPRIFINDIHIPRIKKVLNFWSSLLGLPVRQFGNPVFLKIKQKKVYENYDSYYGVLSLRIRRGSQLKYRIMGLIEAMKPKMSG